MRSDAERRNERMKCCLILIVVVLSWLLLPGPASAAMVVEGYNPANHDRFYSGDDKAFIGDPCNWSGVACNGFASWATMITGDYFLSANHAHPATGSTLTFYYSNDPTGGSETATVASGQEIGNSDVWLGKLSTPVSSNVTLYPVWWLPNPYSYVGATIYTFGLDNNATASQNQRLGRNVIRSLSLGTINSTSTFMYTYDYYNGLGADESLAISGDSGSPALTIVDGVPALAGLVYEGDQASYTIDSFISLYVDQINAAMSGEHVTILPVPEPSALALLTGLVLAALGRLARFRRPNGPRTRHSQERRAIG